MAAVDVVRKLGLVTSGISFAQVVSLALSAALESLRRNGTLPTREGFEFSELLQPFKYDNPRHRGRKLDITQLVQSEAGLVAPPVPTEMPTEFELAQAVKMQRFVELEEKLGRTPQEQEEHKTLSQELFK